jgi:hypothetical protein
MSEYISLRPAGLSIQVRSGLNEFLEEPRKVNRRGTRESTIIKRYMYWVDHINLVSRR